MRYKGEHKLKLVILFLVINFGSFVENKIVKNFIS